MSDENLEKVLREQEEKLRLEKVLSILLEADQAVLNGLLETGKNKAEKRVEIKV